MLVTFGCRAKATAAGGRAERLLLSVYEARGALRVCGYCMANSQSYETVIGAAEWRALCGTAGGAEAMADLAVFKRAPAGKKAECSRAVLSGTFALVLSEDGAAAMVFERKAEAPADTGAAPATATAKEEERR